MASLCNRLAARSHQVTLITLDDGRRERHAVDDVVLRTRLNVMSTSRGWLSKLVHTRTRIQRLRAAVVASTPDVVLAFCDRTNILTLMATRGTGLPVVVCERSDPAQQRLGPMWERLRDRTYRRAAQITALTDTSAEHLRARIPVPVSVIPSAVQSPPFASDRRLAIEAKRVIAVGRLEGEKGFDRLLTGFAGLPGSCDDWKLRILGEGTLRGELEAQVQSLGLGDRVEMPGWVENIWEELASATFFVLSSRYEGFPSALMEAMASGLPSLAVDCESGPRAVIQDPSWGLLVPNDDNALRDGLQRMMLDSDYRERLGAAGKGITECLGWDRMVDHYEQLLQRVVDQRA